MLHRTTAIRVACTLALATLLALTHCSKANDPPEKSASSPTTQEKRVTVTNSWNEDEQYIADAIHGWVYSGFYDEEDVQQFIEDILDGDVDEARLRASVAPLFKAKREAEASWPKVTDCDRLDAAFEKLNAAGVIALHNEGYTKADGEDGAYAALQSLDASKVSGFCYYHGQDVERVVRGEILFIGYGSFPDQDNKVRKIGELVSQALRDEGLKVNWSGDINKRIEVDLDWKRRSP